MIKKICEVFAPSGAERSMTEYIGSSIEFDETYTDNMGSLIARRGNGSRLCVECGIDTAGVMVTSSDNGEIRFAAFGGIVPSALINRKIIFSSGAWGIVRSKSKFCEDTKISDLYAEIENGSAEVGDFAVMDAEFCEGTSALYANRLSDRIGLAAVMCALRGLGGDHDFTVAFTAKKRLGAHGIKAFFGSSDFGHVLTVDGCGKGIDIGSGCAIVAKDKHCVSDPNFRREIEEIADMRGIKHFGAVCDDNLCLENLSIAGNGAVCASLCVPIGSKGENLEYASKADLECTAELIKEIIVKFS